MEDLLFGGLNGLTGIFVLLLHQFGQAAQYPVYDTARNTDLYQFGYLLGVMLLPCFLARAL